MSTIGERLRAHWLAQGIDAPPGATEDRMKESETRFGVTLPWDLREYFLSVDGMGEPFQWDDDLFNFRPRGEVEPTGEISVSLKDGRSYFVFADHSIWLPAYAIRLTQSATDSHYVIAIESDPTTGYASSLVALSFSGFAERYLSGAESRDRLSLGMP
jgi:cell wall assembly regulator SMI1